MFVRKVNKFKEGEKMKSSFRKQIDKDINAKLLLKNASLYQIGKHLLGRLWGAAKAAYGRHTTLTWECVAGAGWALFVLTYAGVV